MVPQWCLAFLKEVFFFFFYAHTFFLRKYIPLVSLLLAPESWAGGAMQGEKAVPWWVGGYEAFWAAPGSHGLLRDTVHGFQENTGGETLGIGRNCRKSSLAQWVSCEVQTLPTTWNLALAGTQVANMNSHSSAGLVCPKNQPCLENRMENWPLWIPVSQTGGCTEAEKQRLCLDSESCIAMSVSSVMVDLFPQCDFWKGH